MFNNSLELVTHPRADRGQGFELSGCSEQLTICNAVSSVRSAADSGFLSEMYTIALCRLQMNAKACEVCRNAKEAYDKCMKFSAVPTNKAPFVLCHSIVTGMLHSTKAGRYCCDNRPQGGVCYTGCFKKSFATLKTYINLFRGHVQCFELFSVT
jgi:hypothetical protein